MWSPFSSDRCQNSACGRGVQPFRQALNSCGARVIVSAQLCYALEKKKKTGFCFDTWKPRSSNAWSVSQSIQDTPAQSGHVNYLLNEVPAHLFFEVDRAFFFREDWGGVPCVGGPKRSTSVA